VLTYVETATLYRSLDRFGFAAKSEGKYQDPFRQIDASPASTRLAFWDSTMNEVGRLISQVFGFESDVVLLAGDFSPAGFRRLCCCTPCSGASLSHEQASRHCRGLVWLMSHSLQPMEGFHSKPAFHAAIRGVISDENFRWNLYIASSGSSQLASLACSL
jgi:hypothetical protein